MNDVSVIIPTYNRARFLPDAIASCAQSASDIPCQVIVVDDCSTDDTGDVLSAIGNRVDRIRFDVKLGRAEARNAGLSASRGEFIKFLDSDDVLEPDAIAREIGVAVDSDADIVVSGWRSILLDGRRRPLAQTMRTFDAPTMLAPIDDILEGKSVPTSSALYRRSYLRDVRWDSRVVHPDDWLFFCQAVLRGGRIARREAFAYTMRHHDAQRVSDASLLEYARDSHYILHEIERALAQRGQLTRRRRLSLAQYYYKQIYVLAYYDVPAFERAVSHIRELDPQFEPWREERRGHMRLLAKLFGFRNAVLTRTAAKHVASHLFRRPRADNVDRSSVR